MSRSTEIALFPLSDVVLFPHILCPLRIFEPRYCAMTAHSLAGDGRIGMVTVRPQYLDDIMGDPPIFEIGCSGVIAEHQDLPDGRYSLVLRGAERFRIVREEPRPAHRLFRVASVDLLEDRPPNSNSAALPHARSRIIELASRLATRVNPAQGRLFQQRDFSHVDDATLVNGLSCALPLSSVAKQQLLEADAVLERFERLESILELSLAESGGMEEVPTRRLH